MAKQTINIGAAPNDGNGDPIREAFDKVNDNDNELYVGAETVAATAKTTPVDADVMPIQDSAASYVKKKVTWANIKATLKTFFDTLYGAKSDVTTNSAKVTCTATTVAAINAAVAGKTVPVDADTLPITDTESANVIKKVTWTNIKAFLKTYFDTLYGTIAQAKFEVLAIAISDETTDLTTGTAKATFRMPFAMTLTGVRASVTTAPVGSSLQVDINETGVSILSTVISIDASTKSSVAAVTPPVISDSLLANDAEMTIDIDQIGSSTAGAGMKVYLIGTRT